MRLTRRSLLGALGIGAVASTAPVAPVISGHLATEVERRKIALELAAHVQEKLARIRKSFAFCCTPVNVGDKLARIDSVSRELADFGMCVRPARNHEPVWAIARQASKCQMHDIHIEVELA